MHALCTAVTGGGPAARQTLSPARPAARFTSRNRVRSSLGSRVKQAESGPGACRAGAAAAEVPRLSPGVDDELSNRWLDLDPAGYFLIRIDREQQLIVAEHYTNIINTNGVACDPDTGKPIPCTPGYVRPPSAVYTGRSAKEISVRLLEEPEDPPLTMLVHANYLGREFQRAEAALISEEVYVQD